MESILAIGFAALSNLQIVKGQKVEPADFVPAHRWRIQRRKPKPAASVAAQKAALRQIAATHNRARR